MFLEDFLTSYLTVKVDLFVTFSSCHVNARLAMEKTSLTSEHTLKCQKGGGKGYKKVPVSVMQSIISITTTQFLQVVALGLFSTLTFDLILSGFSLS